jgi:hypothetical protein
MNNPIERTPTILPPAIFFRLTTAVSREYDHHPQEDNQIPKSILKVKGQPKSKKEKKKIKKEDSYEKKVFHRNSGSHRSTHSVK